MLYGRPSAQGEYMKLNMKIHKIKAIDNLEISLPIEKGLYAITG